jgi:hypothetical protein
MFLSVRDRLVSHAPIVPLIPKETVDNFSLMSISEALFCLDSTYAKLSKDSNQTLGSFFPGLYLAPINDCLNGMVEGAQLPIVTKWHPRRSTLFFNPSNRVCRSGIRLRCEPAHNGANMCSCSVNIREIGVLRSEDKREISSGEKNGIQLFSLDQGVS